MRAHLHVGGRVLSYLDSAPAPPELAQDIAVATPADASRALAPSNVLLFLHAFPLNASMWETEIASPPPGWRFLAADMRGCGQSTADGQPASAGLSLDDYARDVLALLDHLQVRRAVIAGSSMGGYTAFALVRLAAERIAGLVLSNTRPDADSDEAKQGRRVMLGVLDRAGVAGVADQVLPRLVGDDVRRAHPHVVQSIRALATSNDADGIRAAVIRMMNRADSTPLLPRLSCPTLVVASDRDAIIPAERARAMRDAIPGSDLAIIRDAGHLSNLEQPEQFSGALRRFLAARFGG